MVRLIDNTLTSLDHYLPSKEDLHTFCELLFIIGVDAVEITPAVFERMEYLPDNRKFILNINLPEEMRQYPGFYRYISRHELGQDNLMYELQLNDAREIIKLRSLQGCRELRIVGLDDLMCYDSFEKIMKEIKHSVPNCLVNFCPENNYACAGALAIHWAMELEGDITASFTGCKNNAATEEVIMALRLAVRYKPNRDLTVLSQLTRLFEKFTGKSVGSKKPIIGKNIFKVESGIHADGIHKNPITYEAYSPGIVGGKTELVIGKHSGTKAIRLKLEELGLPIPNELMIDKILSTVKSICVLKGCSLKDTEFTELVRGIMANEGDKAYR